MKRKILSLVMLICISISLFGVMPVSALKYGDYLYYEISGGTVTITDCEETATEIEIPSKINGYPVTRIDDYAFYHCDSLTKVDITDMSAWCNIDFAYEYSNPLYYAKKLYLNGELVTDLVIPDGVTAIKNYAFLRCTGITSIIIPDNITSIGESAFLDCTGLTSITIPDSVTSIGKDAFRMCISLAKVYISDIRAWCNINFSNALSQPLNQGGKLYLDGELVTDLRIPNGVSKINNRAFANCRSLTSITIPNSVKSIGDSAFSGCAGLKSISIPSGITIISKETF